jgi:sulfatase modifying factor 1
MSVNWRFIPLFALILWNQCAFAQAARFFRISGPATVRIVDFRPDGTMVWTNTQAGTNYFVQTVTTLPGGTNWVNYVQLVVTQSINTNIIVAFNPPSGMAFIPAGTFTMGDTLDGESDARPTNIYVSAFSMDVKLVTYSQWQTVYVWATNHGYWFANPGAGTGPNEPVQTVDWNDCAKWCNARSQLEGLTPVYYSDAGLTQIFTNGSNFYDPYAEWHANGYRLPTEAEWEKAARGGLIGFRFPWDNTISESQANYYAYILLYTYDLGPNGYNTNNDGFPYTSPVGTFAANGYGLYDMAGNLREWCWDWYGSPYGQLTTNDPTGPTGSATATRVLRGGSFGDWASRARCCNRDGYYEFDSSDLYGFRCVRRY